MIEDEAVWRVIFEVDELTSAASSARKFRPAVGADDDEQPSGRPGSKKAMVTPQQSAAVAPASRTARRIQDNRQLRVRQRRARWHRADLRRTSRRALDRAQLYRFTAPLSRQCRRRRRDKHTAAMAHVNTAYMFRATLKRSWVALFHWFSTSRPAETWMKRPFAGTAIPCPPRAC
jgi:hypothetical protein